MTLRDRLRGAGAALAVQALLGWLLVSGLAVSWRRLPDEALAVFRIAPPPPPPAPTEPPAEHRASPRHRDAPAPPNLRSTATPVVAPPPLVPPLLPPPLIVAASQPATGAQATSGAALVAGPGAGAGGVGNGSGGDGADAGDGDGTPPRWRRGRLKDQDYPRDAALAGTSGTVGVRYLVGTDGRISACRITRSSGSSELDATTCRLIQERFRFDPSRDASGRKVPAWVIETHEWVIDRPAPPAP